MSKDLFALNQTPTRVKPPAGTYRIEKSLAPGNLQNLWMYDNHYPGFIVPLADQGYAVDRILSDSVGDHPLHGLTYAGTDKIPPVFTEYGLGGEYTADGSANSWLSAESDAPTLGINDGGYFIVVDIKDVTEKAMLIGYANNDQVPIHKYGNGIGLKSGNVFAFRSDNNATHYTDLPIKLGYNVIACSFIGSEVILSLNGVSSVGTCASTGYIGAYDFAIGYDKLRSLARLDGIVLMAGKFLGTTSAGELDNFTKDPYQILKPAVSLQESIYPALYPVPSNINGIVEVPTPNGLFALNQTPKGKKPVSDYVIDWSHPLTLNLQSAVYVINGQAVDLVTETHSGGGSGVTREVDGEVGEYLQSDGTGTPTGATTLDGVKLLTGKVPHTVISRVKMPSASVSVYVLSQRGLGYQYMWAIKKQSAQQILIQSYTSSTYAFNHLVRGKYGTISDWYDDIWNTIGFSHDGNSGSSVRFYHDGIFSDETTANNDVSYATTSKFNFIGSSRSVDSISAAGVSYALVFTRELNAAEHRALYKDPYQILKPASSIQQSVYTNSYQIEPAGLLHVDALNGLFALNQRPKGKKPVGDYVVDWSNPLSKGLASFGVSNVDLVYDRKLNYYFNIPDSTADYLHFNDTRNGEAIVLDTIKDVFDGLTEFTVMLECRFHGTTSADEDSLFGQWESLQGSSDLDGRRILIRYDSTLTELQIYIFNSSSVTVSNVQSVSIEDNKFHVFVFTLYKQNLYISVDGELIGSPTSSTIALSSLSNSKYPELMGGHLVSRGTENSPRFDLKSWGLWTTGASSDSIKIVAQDPYQILKPASALQDSFNVSVNTPVAPIAVDDNYTATSGTQKVVPKSTGILINDIYYKD